MFKSLVIKGKYINVLCDSTEGVLLTLFTAFFRVDVKTSRADGGYGLFPV